MNPFVSAATTKNASEVNKAAKKVECQTFQCSKKMFFIAKLIYFWMLFIHWKYGVTNGLKFSADSFSEISMLAKEGKHHFDLINEKSKVPQYGSCWKSAVADLQIGCKFLSENVQSDLALRFTDCFLQMSGHEPIVCETSRDSCLQQLTDRAFNAYTEFYTHTQSICYFLQSQIWHEASERTIDKLSTTSKLVSVQLEEAGKTQEKLLVQQRESLTLQHDLIDNGKHIASALEQSKEKISTIMNDFHSSTVEQKKVLFELFEKLSSLRSWAVGEVAWLNSMLFYTSAVVLAYLFTSTSRLQQARIYIFILLTLNYFIERYIYSAMLNDVNDNYKSITSMTEEVNSWIWMCRKVLVSICVLVTLFIACSYCDYNMVNYQLLLEIKNQNYKILNYFKRDITMENAKKNKTNVVATSKPELNLQEIIPLPYQPLYIKRDNTPVKEILLHKRYNKSSQIDVIKSNGSVISKEVDNISVISEKSNNSFNSYDSRQTYNLRRSSRVVKKNAATEL